MEIIDVPGDGNCFYTCVVRCVMSDETLQQHLAMPNREDDAVTWLRAEVGEMIRNNSDVRSWLLVLCELCRECKKMKQEYPLLKGAISRKDLVDNITVEQVWASELEVRIVNERILCKQDIALVILEGGSNADYLVAALDKVTCSRCILLVRKGDSHYQYVKHRGNNIMLTKRLLYDATVLAMTLDSDDEVM